MNKKLLTCLGAAFFCSVIFTGNVDQSIQNQESFCFSQEEQCQEAEPMMMRNRARLIARERSKKSIILMQVDKEMRMVAQQTEQRKSEQLALKEAREKEILAVALQKKQEQEHMRMVQEEQRKEMKEMRLAKMKVQEEVRQEKIRIAAAQAEQRRLEQLALKEAQEKECQAIVLRKQQEQEALCLVQEKQRKEMEEISLAKMREQEEMRLAKMKEQEQLRQEHMRMVVQLVEQRTRERLALAETKKMPAPAMRTVLDKHSGMTIREQAKQVARGRGEKSMQLISKELSPYILAQVDKALNDAMLAGNVVCKVESMPSNLVAIHGYSKKMGMYGARNKIVSEKSSLMFAQAPYKNNINTVRARAKEVARSRVYNAESAYLALQKAPNELVVQENVACAMKPEVARAPVVHEPMVVADTAIKNDTVKQEPAARQVAMPASIAQENVACAMMPIINQEIVKQAQQEVVLAPVVNEPMVVADNAVLGQRAIQNYTVKPQSDAPERSEKFNDNAWATIKYMLDYAKESQQMALESVKDLTKEMIHTK